MDEYPEDKIHLKHCTEESIKTEKLEIITRINGKKHIYNSSKVYTDMGNNSCWELGEVLEINTRRERGRDIKDYDEVDLYLIGTPTKELIQKARLTTDLRKAPYVFGLITPKGRAIDTFTRGSAKLSDAWAEEQDGVNCTKYKLPKKNYT